VAALHMELIICAQCWWPEGISWAEVLQLQPGSRREVKAA
jgi:hypothetical protein